MGAQDQSLGISILRDDLGVSNERIEKLKIFEGLLIKWQKAQNLVSRETLEAVWLRHICDSARLSLIIEGSGRWLDLGSGAGFPGLVMAILQSDAPQGDENGFVYLVESNTRKASFLRNVIRELDLGAEVFNHRIEDVAIRDDLAVSYLSARALAPLDRLLGLSMRQTELGARCFFHKGRDIDAEIEEAANNWDFNLIKHSVSASTRAPSDGIILEVSNISRKVLGSER